MARGGRGGGSRNPANQPREQQVSRKVSWLLRHGAGSEGLKLGPGGYVNVADALNTRCLQALHVTFPELRSIVSTNDKQRFSMIPVSPSDSDSTSPTTPPSTNPADYLIRANQGHSIKLEADGLLTPITLEANNVPSTVIHGTDERAWNLILKSGGLRRMGRNHIHFAAGLPAGFRPFVSSSSSPTTDTSTTDTSTQTQTPPVISGMRTSSSILIYIDIHAALAAGIKFFVSDNGVILTEGDESGVLSYVFFERVESRRTGDVVMRDGKLPEGVVVDVGAWEEEVGGKGKGKGKGRGGGRAGGGRGRGRGKPSVDDGSAVLEEGGV